MSDSKQQLNKKRKRRKHKQKKKINIEEKEDSFPFLSSQFSHIDFPHLNRELFKQLIIDIEYSSGIDRNHLEKDYYITLCLYIFQELGINFILKGGSSLSKGYNIIKRTAEDVDIIITKITKGPILDNNLNFKPLQSFQVQHKLHFFQKLEKILKNNIPGCNIRLSTSSTDFLFAPDYSTGVFWVSYESHFPEYFGNEEKNSCFSSVILEISAQPVLLPKLTQSFSNRIKSHIANQRDIKSYLELYSNKNQRDFALIWPESKQIYCVHPVITILQKITDCLVYRFDRELLLHQGQQITKGNKIITAFDNRNVRHFEDCAEVILAFDNKTINPPINGLTPKNIQNIWPYISNEEIILYPKRLFNFLNSRRIFKIKSYNECLYTLDALKYDNSSKKWRSYLQCYEERKVFHWGERLSLEECSNIIITWLKEHDI